MELSEKQKEIVECLDRNIIVIAAAASGKTRVLTERVKFLVNRGFNPKKIVVITFTNAAAEEMRSRLPNTDDIFIGTVHSYANYLLLAAGISTRETLDKENFDTLFDMVKNNPNCIKPVNFLLLDEAQDSTQLQFEFILKMIKPKSIFFVGDFRQSIYGFDEYNPARPDILMKLMKSKNCITFYLNENYRNARNILEFAKGIIRKCGDDYRDDSIPIRKSLGLVYQRAFTLTEIVNIIKQQPPDTYNNWFILCRYNIGIDQFCSLLQRHHIPCDTFKKAQLSAGDLQRKLEENTVKVLTIHTSKGLEANNVVVYGARWTDPEEIRVNYVAATRARDKLYWMNYRR